MSSRTAKGEEEELKELREKAVDRSTGPMPSHSASSARHGREPVEDPVWLERAFQLASLVERPTPIGLLLSLARRSLKWEQSMTVNTLCVAEDKYLFWAGDKWNRYDNAYNEEKKRREDANHT